jgi:hypothetical protein
LDVVTTEHDRKKRLRPEAVAQLAELKKHLAHMGKFGVVTRAEANRAYADAIAQVVSNDACLMDDDREYTRVRCRDCGHTTSALKGVDQWQCRCSRATRQVFVDAIGSNGDYLLDAHAMPLRPTSDPVPETEDEMIRGYFGGFSPTA